MKLKQFITAHNSSLSARHLTTFDRPAVYIRRKPRPGERTPRYFVYHSSGIFQGRADRVKDLPLVLSACTACYGGTAPVIIPAPTSREILDRVLPALEKQAWRILANTPASLANSTL